MKIIIFGGEVFMKKIFVLCICIAVLAIVFVFSGKGKYTKVLQDLNVDDLD